MSFLSHPGVLGVLAKYYTLRLKQKTWFAGRLVNMRAFFTVVIVIIINIIIFALQMEFIDDSWWIAEDHALN